MLKWLKRLAIAVAGLLALAAVLRLGFGLHVYLDGDFRPHLAFGSSSAHYDALERQRAAQRAAGAAPPIAELPQPAPSPVAAAAPAATGPGPDAAVEAAPPGAASPPPARTPAASAWTDYRGPDRDGVYRERALAATWPAGGPPRLWKQPIGEGHASFAVAGGVA